MRKALVILILTTQAWAGGWRTARRVSAQLAGILTTADVSASWTRWRPDGQGYRRYGARDAAIHAAPIVALIFAERQLLRKHPRWEPVAFGVNSGLAAWHGYRLGARLADGRVVQ